MTQRETVLALLKTHKRVTLRMLFEAGVGYTGRNRISELKRQGYIIQHQNGESPSDNAYILVSEPMQIQTDQNGQQAFA